MDHEAFVPGPQLFRHWIDHVGDLAGSVYGRRMYEVMRYWDDDDPAWTTDEQAFAAAWRSQPKWVVSRSSPTLGPTATLVAENLEETLRSLKADVDGEVDVSGTILAESLTQLGLIDEYRLYLHPVVLGGGTPFFAGPRPRLHLVATDQIDDEVIRISYVPK